MTKREAVFAAVNHQNPGYVPWQLDLTEGMAEVLKRYFGKADFLYSCAGNHLVREKNKKHVRLDEFHHRDLFGVVWKKEAGGDIGVVERYPLADDDPYDFPVPDTEMIRGKCRAMAAEHPGLFRVFELSFSYFERAWSLRGMENVLMDMASDSGRLEEILDRLLQYNLEVIDIAVAEDIDAVMFGDDWASQSGLMMGPVLWRRFIKPGMSKMFDRARLSGKHIILHSCGNALEIMDDLVDMGLNIYNTFQPEVYDMQDFKRRYGDRITVYGGVSTQGALFHGTPAAVREETLRTMEIMARNGGYIAAPTHQIPMGTPVGNVLAFLEAVKGL